MLAGLTKDVEAMQAAPVARTPPAQAENAVRFQDRPIEPDPPKKRGFFSRLFGKAGS